MKTLLLLCSLVMSHLSYAAPWSSTAWQVSCEEIVAASYPNECNPANPASAVTMAQTTLESVSNWLESLDFTEPDMEKSATGQFQALFMADELALRRQPWGAPGASGILELSANYFIVNAANPGHGSFLATILPKEHGIIHALGHGMMETFGRFFFLREADWIQEGMSEAISMAWFLNSSGRSDIPVPDVLLLDKAIDGYREYEPSGFNTYYFWLNLGREIGSPGFIGYFNDVFTNVAAGRRRAAESAFRVHEVLQAYDPAGLYNLYPEFIATQTDSRNFFAGSPLGYHRESLSMTATNSPLVAEFESSIQSLQAQSWDLHIDPFGWSPLEVTITLQGEVPANLHLSVDGIRRDDESLGADRNIYRLTLTDALPTTLNLRVSEIAPDVSLSAQTYSIRVELEGGVWTPGPGPSPLPRDCTESTMAAALYSSNPETMAGIERIVAGRAAQVAVDTRNMVYRLGQGRHWEGGPGQTCVSHFGVSDLEWSSRFDPGFIYEITKAAVISRYMPAAIAASGFTEAEIMGLIEEGTVPAGATAAQIMSLLDVIQTAAAEVQTDDPADSGVFFHVFAPSVIPAVTGQIEIADLNNRQAIVTQHEGVGGWPPNSAANYIIYMPGVAAADIAAGNSYPAKANANPIEGEGYEYATPADNEGPNTSEAFLTSWTGDFQELSCNGETTEAFEGVQFSYWGKMEGTVSISSVTDSEITGSYSLYGNAIEEFKYYSIVATGNPNCPLTSNMELRVEVRPRTKYGSFTAPNLAAPGTFNVALHGRAVRIDP